jgi:hypothetical protein
LDAAHELCEGTLDTVLGDRRVAEGRGEQGRVVGERPQPRDQRVDVGVAQGAAEAHLGMVLHGHGGLHLQAVGALIPEEVRLLTKARVHQPHAVPSRGARHTGARLRGVAEGELLPVTAGAADGAGA